MKEEDFLLFTGAGADKFGVFKNDINKSIVDSGMLDSLPTWITKSQLPASTEETIIIGSSPPFKIDNKNPTNNQNSIIYISSDPNYFLKGIYKVKYNNSYVLDSQKENFPEATFLGFILLDEKNSPKQIKNSPYFINKTDYLKFELLENYITWKKGPQDQILDPLYGLKIFLESKNSKNANFKNLCDIILAETIKSYLL